MTVTLDLPPDLETEISARAAERGQAVPDYLLALAEADVLAKRKARIAGTRMKVTHIAEEHTRLGMTAEQIVEAHPHLALLQVNAALASYYSNRDAMEAEMAASLAHADQARQQAGVSSLAARLRGLKAPLSNDSLPPSHSAPRRNPAGGRISKRIKDRE